jgi:hypothetical protein
MGIGCHLTSPAGYDSKSGLFTGFVPDLLKIADIVPIWAHQRRLSPSGVSAWQCHGCGQTVDEMAICGAVAIVSGSKQWMQCLGGGSSGNGSLKGCHIYDNRPFRRPNPAVISWFRSLMRLMSGPRSSPQMAWMPLESDCRPESSPLAPVGGSAVKPGNRGMKPRKSDSAPGRLVLRSRTCSTMIRGFPFQWSGISVGDRGHCMGRADGYG